MGAAVSLRCQVIGHNICSLACGFAGAVRDSDAVTVESGLVRLLLLARLPAVAGGPLPGEQLQSVSELQPSRAAVVQYMLALHASSPAVG